MRADGTKRTRNGGHLAVHHRLGGARFALLQLLPNAGNHLEPLLEAEGHLLGNQLQGAGRVGQA
jgi:hypothetical protein